MKKTLIIGIILIVISGIIFVYRMKKIQFMHDHCINIYQITNSGAKEENINAFINASYIGGAIANLPNNDKESYYVIFDEGVQHIVYLKNSDAKKINQYLMDNPNQVYKLFGVTRLIPNNMVRFGKDFVHEWLDNNHHDDETEAHSHEITDDEFYEYFGYVYLDATYTPYNYLNLIVSILGLCGLTIVGYELYQKYLNKSSK